MAARLLLAIALLASSLWFLFPNTAHACSCVSLSVQETIQYFDVIAVGEVVSIGPEQEVTRSPREGAPDLARVFDIPVYEFLVDEYLVGSGKPLIEVRDTSRPCGYLRESRNSQRVNKMTDKVAMLNQFHMVIHC